MKKDNYIILLTEANFECQSKDFTSEKFVRQGITVFRIALSAMNNMI